MIKSRSTYDQIADTLGNVCLWWTGIEHLVHDIVLHLAFCLDNSFQNDTAWDILHITLSNEDVRQKIATAKTLSHKIDYPESPKFYERAEELLNFLDNVSRPERNRYIHDMWETDGTEIVRLKLGARVLKTQSFKRELVTTTETRFSNANDVGAFVTNLELVYEDLVQLDNHIAGMSLLKDQAPHTRSPLPLLVEWKSLIHHALRAANKSAPQAPPSPK